MACLKFWPERFISDAADYCAESEVCRATGEKGVKWISEDGVLIDLEHIADTVKGYQITGIVCMHFNLCT